MTVVDSRLMRGTLSFTIPDGGGSTLDASCQVTSVVVKASVTKGTIAKVLCGDSTDSGGTIDYTLDATVIQDFDSTDGFVWWCLDNAGKQAQFTWKPNNRPNVQELSGTVTVTPIDIGGGVETQITSQFSWTMSGPPERKPAPPAAPAAPSGAWA